MKYQKSHVATALAVASVLTAAGSAFAQSELTISSFPAGFTLDAYYANWSTATIGNSSPGFAITSSGYGSGAKNLASALDGSAYSMIQMTVDVAGPVGPPISSAIADLTDADGTQVQFAMQYGLLAGNGQTFSEALSAGHIANAGGIPGLDLSHITAFNIEDDPGGFSGPYTITYRDLGLVNAPEPGSLAAIGAGIAGLLIARRRK
jgi:PEP-CTERM motif